MPACFIIHHIYVPAIIWLPTHYYQVHYIKVPSCFSSCIILFICCDHFMVYSTVVKTENPHRCEKDIKTSTLLLCFLMLTSNRQIGSLLTLQINLLCPFFFYNKNLTRLHSGISARLTIQTNLRLCLFSKEEMVAVGGFLKFKTDPRLRVFNVTDAL